MFVGWLKRHFAARRAKRSSMRKTALKDQLYGSILEMMNNRDYFYRSDIGKHHEYSHWTDLGKEELLDFVMSHSRRMLTAEDEIVRNKAKEMTFESLKKPE
jgi:hypothetical protein